jgi:hypothetical protein
MQSGGAELTAATFAKPSPPLGTLGTAERPAAGRDGALALVARGPPPLLLG